VRVRKIQLFTLLFLALVCIQLAWAQQTENKQNASPVYIWASSFVIESPEKYGRYHPIRAFDGDPLTAWNEGAEGAGIGEKLDISFDETVTLDTIKIMPGYFDQQWYYANNRVKKLTIIFHNLDMTVDRVIYTVQIHFSDEMKEQEIRLEREINCKYIEFRIDDVYKGNKYDDTCISEIKFYHNEKQILLDFEQNTAFVSAKERIGSKDLTSPAGYRMGIFGAMGEGELHYFFPDGTYILIYSYLENPKIFGKWSFGSDNKTVIIHYELEIGIVPIGEGVCRGIGYATYYRDYKYYEEKLNKEIIFNWFEFYQKLKGNTNDHMPSGVFPLTFVDYKMNNRSFTLKMKEYVDACIKQYYELGGK
jgi:hypothetical protein